MRGCIRLLLNQTLVASLPEDVAAFPSRVFSSSSRVKLLDLMEPKYEKFSTVSSASSLRMILASSVPWLIMRVFLMLILRQTPWQVLEKLSMIYYSCSSELEQKAALFA